MGEIVRSFLLTLLFGSALGVLRPLQDELIGFLYRLIASPVRTYRALKGGEGLRCTVRRVSMGKGGSSALGLFLADLLFVSAAGIGFILLLYVATDGVFRFFMLLTVVSAGFFAYSFMGRPFGKAARWLLSLPIAAETFFSYLIIKSFDVIFCHHINAHNRLTK